MSYLILIRHGQSTWNLEGRFTGWVDVDLTENGKLEAKRAGELIKKLNIKIDYYFTSLQLRANNTLKIIQTTLNDKRNFIKGWELNERHYGMLTGLNKVEMGKKIGEEKVHQFRRSWDLRPEPLNQKSSFHPLNIDTYNVAMGYNAARDLTTGIQNTIIGGLAGDALTDADRRQTRHSPRAGACRGDHCRSHRRQDC